MQCDSSAFGSLARRQFAFADINRQVVCGLDTAIRYVTLNTNFLRNTFVCWLMLQHVSALTVGVEFCICNVVTVKMYNFRNLN